MTTVDQSLTPVRFYTQQDPYFYTVDNRPLTDLDANDQVLGEGIDASFSNLRLVQAELGRILGAMVGTSTGLYTATFQINGLIFTIPRGFLTYTGQYSASDPRTVFKFAFMYNDFSYTVNTPGTGNSKEFLVEYTFRDTKSTDSEVPYLNDTNPFGLEGVIGGVVELRVKEGLPATSGTQVIPSLDSGYYELATINVTGSPTSIAQSNITYSGNMKYLSDLKIGSSSTTTTTTTSSYVFTSLTASTSSLPVDLSQSNYFDITLKASTTLTFTEPATSHVEDKIIKFTQDSTGGWNVTFPSGVINRGYDIKLAPNAESWVRLIKYGNSNWEAFALQYIPPASTNDIISGIESNLPSASGSDKLYLATDTDNVFVDSGSSWVTVDHPTRISYDSHNKLSLIDSTALLSLTRGSQGSYIDNTGTIQTATQNEPRQFYDPSTTNYRGLVLESQSQNLILNSEVFSSYNLTGVASSTATVTAPDGSTSSPVITEDTSAGNHRIGIPVTANVGTHSTLSIFARSSNRNLVLDATSFLGSTAGFNLSSGTTSNTGNAAIENYGNGWYRCSISGVSTGTSGTVYVQMQSTGLVSATYTGDGSSTMDIWGAQFEPRSRATSYIKTTGTSQTRSADTAQITNLYWLKTYGTLVLETYWHDLQGLESGTPTLVSGNKNSFTLPQIDTASLNTEHYYSDGTNTYTVQQLASLVNSGTNKIAITWTMTGMTIAVNGNTVKGTVNMLNEIDAQSKLLLGSGFNQVYLTNATYYPRNFNSLEMISVTT